MSISTRIDDGGPAFPCRVQYTSPGGCGGEMPMPGMSLRDHFAGCALSGEASNPGFGYTSFKDAAKWAYQMADAMLDERERTGGHE